MKPIFTSEQNSCSRNYLHGPKQGVHYLTRLLAVTLSLCFFSFMAIGQGIGATAVGFEVDANFKSNNIPSFWKFTNPNQTYFPGNVLGADWSKGAAGTAVLKQLNNVSVPGLTADRTALWQVDGNWGTNVPPDESVFAGSSNKNGDLIDAANHPYALDQGSGGPQKNDITNVFLHTRRDAANGNALWFYFGAETRSVNGSSYLDFEYNQAGVIVRNDSMIGLGPVGGRTVNDLLLVINYTKGGTVPIVGIRRWQADGTWSAELALPAGTTYMSTNTLDVDAVAPNMAYTGDGTPTSTTAAFQFVEGAVNINSLNLTGLDQCTPNATVTVKTRSSASYTSELKDWDILHFPLTPAAVAAVANITPQCAPTSGSTVFNVSGTYADGTPVWSTTAGTLSAQNYTNGVATATLTLAAGVLTANVTLTTTSANASCPAAISTKTATVYSRPVVVASATPAGSLSMLTVPPQYQLHTTVNSVLDPTTGFTYAWSQNPPTSGLSSTSIPNPTFSAPAAGEYTWTVLVTNINGCTNTSSVTRELIPQAPCPAVLTPEMCAGTSHLFGADVGPATGETWAWTANNGAVPNAPVNAQTVNVTAGTQSFTLTLTKTYANPALSPQVCNYPVTVNPAAATPSVAMSVITCTTTSMTITISSPTSTSTYDIYQLNQNHVVKSPPHANPLTVTGLALGQGYRVIGTTNKGCISSPYDCGDFSTFVPQAQNVVAKKTVESTITDEPVQEAAKVDNKDVINIELLAGKPSITAAPNPYNDKISFSVMSQVSGFGSLEVYNLVGQKVATIFEGNFEQAKSRQFDYRVPVGQRKSLIYVFRVGTQKTSGLLIGSK